MLSQGICASLQKEEEQFDKGIYEDYDCNKELENLYFSKFDTLDEVIYFRDVFTGLEQQNNQMYNFHLGCLNQQELVSFQNSINTAHQLSTSLVMRAVRPDL